MKRNLQDYFSKKIIKRYSTSTENRKSKLVFHLNWFKTKMHETTNAASFLHGNRKLYFKDLLRNRIIKCCFSKFSLSLSLTHSLTLSGSMFWMNELLNVKHLNHFWMENSMAEFHIDLSICITYKTNYRVEWIFNIKYNLIKLFQSN